MERYEPKLCVNVKKFGNFYIFTNNKDEMKMKTCFYERLILTSKADFDQLTWIDTVQTLFR